MTYPLAATAALALVLSSIPAAAGAQTPVSALPPPLQPPGMTAPAAAPPAMPMPAAQALPAQALPAQALPPGLPASEETVIQALSQRDGMYPVMTRSLGGGQIQAVWNTSDPAEGVQTYPFCDGACVYKVRVREFMSTAVILPEDAVIDMVDLGDASTFQVSVRGRNMISVRPATWGVDSNLNVTTKAGKVYPFYLRAEGYNSQNTPDLVVRILGRETPAPVEGLPVVDLTTGEMVGDGDPAGPVSLVPAAMGGKAAPASAAPAPEVPDLRPPAAGPDKDFVRSVPFDPSQLHGWNDYRLWGDDELRPETVFRDGQFTYIQFGRRWDGLELPVAYIVIDGIDELVNSRVTGSTFIVESTQGLITLKSGKKYLCIQYTGRRPGAGA